MGASIKSVSKRKNAAAAGEGACNAASVKAADVTDAATSLHDKSAEVRSDVSCNNAAANCGLRAAADCDLHLLD